MKRVLLDQSVPIGVRRLLEQHDVTSAAYLGWEEVGNGELIARAEEAGFEVFVTADRNLRHQQNIDGRRLAIVALGTNRWNTIRADPNPLIAAVDGAEPGSYRELDATRSSPSNGGRGRSD